MFIGYTIIGHDKALYVNPCEDCSIIFVMYVEIICSFLMISMVMHVKSSQLGLSSDGMVLSAGCCSVIYALVIIASPYSGAAFNPWIGFCNISF